MPHCVTEGLMVISGMPGHLQRVMLTFLEEGSDLILICFFPSGLH